MKQRARNEMAARGYVEVTVEDWTALKTAVAVLNSDMETMKENHLPHIYKELKGIREKMSSYRPPWSVVAIITFLSSVCVALIVHAIF